MNAPPPPKNYLEKELEELITSDPAIFAFIRQGSLDGVWYWDLENSENEWMSPEFWRLFGVDPWTKTHKAAEWQDLINQDDLAEALKNFKLHCANPNHPYDQVVRYRHADGSTVWVRCRGLAIRDETGRPIRMLGAHNDLTQQMRTAEALKGEADATAAVNRELREFAYAISHDLKSPANTLKMLLEEMPNQLDSDMSPGAKDMLEMSMSCVDRMRTLIEDVLDYTRLIGDAPRRESVQLDPIIADIRSDLTADIDRSAATVRIGALPAVMGDPTQVRILFQNLIANALKFSAPDTPPVVDVLAGKAGADGLVPIRVCDQGIGIDPSQHQKIFEMFTRLHADIDYSGSGLGLAICQRIVANHGGRIELRSALGDGTEFTIWLPGGNE
ncbi:MAG: ATP-binding protein [Pseudomonadota bacterium]